MEDVQQQTVRMISGLRGDSYDEKLKEVGLCTLEERRHQTDMLQVYKILHGWDRVTPFFETAAARATRLAPNPLNIKVPQARLE